MTMNSNKQGRTGGDASIESNGKEALDTLVTEIEASLEELALDTGQKKNIRKALAAFRKPGAAHGRTLTLFPDAIAALRRGNEQSKEYGTRLAAQFAPDNKTGTTTPVCADSNVPPEAPAVSEDAQPSGATPTAMSDSNTASRRNATQVANQSPDEKQSYAPTGATYNYGRLPQPDRHPLLDELTVSEFNRSHTVPPSKSRVDRLESSIRAYGIIQRVLLARVPGVEDRFVIVSGAGRVEAKKRICPGGRLEAREYDVIDLPANDKRLLAISNAENRDRAVATPVELAFLIKDQIARNNFSQQEIADQLKIQRTVVSDYQALAECEALLPESWRNELRMTDDDDRVITFSHWRAIKGRIKEGEKLPKELKKLCEAAVTGKWTVARLAEAMRSDSKRKDTKITDASGLSVPIIPPMESAGRNNTDAASIPAASMLKHWSEDLHKTAAEMHGDYETLEAKVLDAANAVDAELKHIQEAA